MCQIAHALPTRNIISANRLLDLTPWPRVFSAVGNADVYYPSVAARRYALRRRSYLFSTTFIIVLAGEGIYLSASCQIILWTAKNFDLVVKIDCRPDERESCREQSACVGSSCLLSPFNTEGTNRCLHRARNLHHIIGYSRFPYFASCISCVGRLFLFLPKFFVVYCLRSILYEFNSRYCRMIKFFTLSSE